jgi:hypothetical protein
MDTHGLYPHELQMLLRRFEPLRNVTVQYESPEKQAIAPHVMTICGYVLIDGEPKYYETEVNTALFTGPDDILLLVRNLLRSFEDASRAARSVA